MSGHTKGPWFVQAATEVDERDISTVESSLQLGQLVATAWGGGKMTDDIDANARLIAAAPELLEALQRCAELLDDYSDVNDGEDGQPVPNRAMSLLRDVESAIAKAEGR